MAGHGIEAQKKIPPDAKVDVLWCMRNGFDAWSRDALIMHHTAKCFGAVEDDVTVEELFPMHHRLSTRSGLPTQGEIKVLKQKRQEAKDKVKAKSKGEPEVKQVDFDHLLFQTREDWKLEA